MADGASFVARPRLTPSHFDRAINSAAMYTPADAVGARFLDRVVSPEELQQAALEAARELAGLNAEAHKATKLKSRASLIVAVRTAIEAELWRRLALATPCVAQPRGAGTRPSRWSCCQRSPLGGEGAHSAAPSRRIVLRTGMG